MKPEKAQKVDIDSDISAIAILHAEETIRKKLDRGYSKEISFVVKIPSQSFSYIYPLAYAMGFSIELEVSYDVDEWSLIGGYLDFTKKPENITHEVWSPGA